MPEQSNITEFGIILGSTDPERLAAWYRAALEPLGAVWQDHLLLLGGAAIGFDRRDDVAPKTAEPGRQLVNVVVRDIRAAEAHLNALDVTWVRPVEEEGDEDGWVFSTILDPDGNYVQFLQGPAAP